MRTAPVLLRHPWSLWDDATQDPVPDHGQVEIHASTASLVAADASLTLRPGGRSTLLHRGREHLGFDGSSWRLWDVAAPAKDEGGVPVEWRSPGGANGVWSFAFPGAVHRPTPGHPAIDAAYALDGLIGVQVERLERAIAHAHGRRTVTGAMQGLVRATWSDLDEIVLAPDDPGEPAMALIVRHANEMRRAVQDLVDHPRRVLRRVRQRASIGRIQEMDAACLTWYVRRPGRTAAEKAGPEQKLMAVVRNESVDTLENRVLKDFLKRSRTESDAYLRANRALADSRRYHVVRRYATMLRRSSARPELADVRPLASVPAPNYVLQQDRRYRALWHAYLDLVRRAEVLDEAWSWQRRLWRDTVALTVTSALSTVPEARPYRATAPYLRTEQDHGRWTDRSSMVRLFDVTARRRVVLRIARSEHDDDSSATSESGLRADLRVDAHELDGHGHAFGFAWAVHGVDARETDLTEAVASADRALGAWHGHAASRNEAPRGLVLAARHDPYAPVTGAAAGTVDGLAIPLAGPSRSDAIDAIADWLLDVARRSVG